MHLDSTLLAFCLFIHHPNFFPANRTMIFGNIPQVLDDQLMFALLILNLFVIIIKFLLVFLAVDILREELNVKLLILLFISFIKKTFCVEFLTTGFIITAETCSNLITDSTFDLLSPLQFIAHPHYLIT